MSIPSRRYRELRALVDRAGLTLVAGRTTGSGHVLLVVQAADGRRGRVTAASTPSDYFADANVQADLRRVARGRATA